MEKDDRNFVNIDSNFFGDMRFYFNKDLYTIEDFRNDFTEWKEVMLSKKNISQGYQNFEAFFVIAAHNYLKKNQHFKKKSYYLKYFEGFEIDEKETDIESDFYFINQKGNVEKLFNGSIELSSDLKIWLLTNTIPDSVDKVKSISARNFSRISEKVNYVEFVYLFPFMALKSDIKNLFYQIYKSNWSYSETLVHRSRTIIDFELSKPDHVTNAFESINESKNCFEITYIEDLNLENQFVYKYKKSKSKKTLNENEKEIIGHKIILKYPKKSSVKEGDPTYWSVYSDLNLLQYLIQLSIEVGEVSSLTLKQIFERITPSAEQRSYSPEDVQQNKNFKTSNEKHKADTSIEELSEFGFFNKNSLESKMLRDILNNIDLDTQETVLDEDILEKTLLLEFLKVNAQGLTEFEAEFLEIFYAEVSSDNPELFLIISEYLEEREKLLHLIYKGKIKQETIEKRLEDKLGVRKIKKVTDFFDEMVEKINDYKVNVLKEENKNTNKMLLINYFQYRFVQ